jgi:hypothetical protein
MKNHTRSFSTHFLIYPSTSDTRIGGMGTHPHASPSKWHNRLVTAKLVTGDAIALF